MSDWNSSRHSPDHPGHPTATNTMLPTSLWIRVFRDGPSDDNVDVGDRYPGDSEGSKIVSDKTDK